MSLLDKQWEVVQKKTFARWCNTHLRKRGMAIDEKNIEKEFEDGIKLIHLYEIISDNSLGKYNPAPKMRIHKLANLNVPLKEINKFVRSVGIKLDYNAEEISDGVAKQVLGMIWCLIHKFEIQDITEEEMSAREGLLLWCQKNTKGYKDVKVDNFNYSWQDGLAFCALINKFHPELLDFSQLDKANALENLRLAFTVADQKLDIPALLDPEDMINMKPDDKAVMTYVANYWRKFATGQKAGIAAKRISKMLDKQKQNEAMKSDYENRAHELARWTKEKTNQMEDRDFGNCLEQVQGKSKGFNGYRTAEKPPKTAEKLDLEALLSNLKAKQKAEGSPVYEPPEDISPSTLQNLWDTLGKKEYEYDAALREALLRHKRLDLLLQRFRAKVKKLNNWIHERQAYLGADPAVDNISQAQAKLKIHEGYEDEYQAQSDNFAACENLGNEIINAQHAAAGECQEALSNMTQSRRQLEDMSAALKAKLQAELDRLSKLDNACLEFAKKSEKFNIWAEDAQDVLNDVARVSSVAEVEDLENNLNKVATEHSNQQATVNELQRLNDEIAEQGYSNPYSRFTIDQVKDRYVDMTHQIGNKVTEIQAEKQRQLVNADIITSYGAKAQEIINFVKASKAEIESIPGAFEEQLTQVKSKSAGLHEKGAHLLNELQAQYQKIVDADIIESTPISVQEVQTQLDQLGNIIKKRIEFLEKSILSEQASQVPPEQLAEYRTTFNHFDKRKCNRLSKLDFKACTQALGVDLSEQELMSTINEFDKNKDNEIEFDEFVEFMITRVSAKSDSAADIMAAFKTIAGDKEFCTEGDLRKALSKEEADFLIQHMPKNQNGFDYKAYVNTQYAGQ